MWRICTGIPRRRYEGNIKKDRKEVWPNSVGWIHVPSTRSRGLLLTQSWRCGFYRMGGIYWLPGEVSACQDELRPVGLPSWVNHKFLCEEPFLRNEGKTWLTLHWTVTREINPLQTNRRPLYLKTQSVPRCKHFSCRLQKPISLYVEIKCQLDATEVFIADLIACSNMFRAPLCPSSGAQEYYTVVAACGIWCCGFQVIGLVWSWGLCVWFAGCCSNYRIILLSSWWLA